MIFKDYYKILGLETNKVNIDDIKAAYREQAKKYHPDVNIGNKNAEERFKDINEAYKVLLNPTTKKKYDKMWNTHIAKKKVKYEESKRLSGSAFSEFFNMFFGIKEETVENKSRKLKENNTAPVQGENVETEIQIPLEEAFYGAKKKRALRTVNGKMKNFEIAIPAGIHPGEKVRLLGQGMQGENGGKNGDLLIKIKILENKSLKLKGNDIYKDVLLSPLEAVLGTKINVETIDETMTIFIPQGIETGDTIKIPEKGYKDGKGGRGNFVANIKIMIPKNISEQEKKLYKQIKEVSKFNPRKEYI